VTVDGSIDRTRIARRDRAARRLPTVLGMQLRHRIGLGGEGEVWAAAARDGSPRAVKLIRPDVVAEPVTFARRAEALARIDDPAFVRVLNARVLASGEWAGWGAMVMELVEGEPLDDAHLGAAAFADLEPLALALDRLHDGEWSDGDPLVHRDVKPSNLIRADDGRIVLVDPSSLRTVGGDMTYVGTPLFVAPEVPSGRFGRAADVYSFAATLLALYAGARGDELAGLLAEPETLDVPEPLIRALSPVPGERPERCADLVDTTQTVVLRATSPVQHAGTAPQTSRTWWRLGLLTAAAVPIITGLLLPSPVVVLAGIAALAGLLAIDPALRDSSLAWPPLAVARWLAPTLEADDDVRDRVTATVHGAQLLPFAPILGVLLGYGPRMVVLGTVGQLAGVAVICALALTWFVVATADDGTQRLTVARALLLPIWIVGVFAQAVVHVVVAVNDALRAADADAAAADGADADAAAADDAGG
jgi:serine/threonine protein kinase